MRERNLGGRRYQSVANGTYYPKEYWSNVAQGARSGDGKGFAPVLHPGAPAWFNELIDKLQYRAMRRALHMADLAPGARLLDVGCGTGRWLRRYQTAGLRALGVDATLSMLAIAQEHRTTAPLIAGEACRLPFGDAQFDCVSDVTVVQHIPVSLQPLALGEMIRVLKPNGRLILMELIRGDDSHIFPHRSEEWIAQARAAGAGLVGWFGQEYLLLDRALVRAARLVISNKRQNNRETLERDAALLRRTSANRRAYWALRHVTAPISGWIEPIVEHMVPSELATHGVFVFKKR